MSQTHIFSKGAFWLGIICIILGCVLLFSPVLQALFSVSFIVFIGIMMLIGGLVYFVGAFKENGKNLLLMLLLSLALIILGVLCIMHPIQSSLILTLIISGILVVAGCAKIALAFYMPGNVKVAFILGGICSIIIAGLIWAFYPTSGIIFLGILFGVELIISGVVQIIMASYEVKVDNSVSKLENEAKAEIKNA